MCENEKHTFELSGLGKPPFKIVNNDHGNKAYWCEHCGTGLKHRYFVESSDGKVSVVGSDCLGKSGDQGLVDGAKRIKREKRAQARLDKWAEEHQKKLEKEREKFGGKTHEEVRQDYLEAIDRAKEKAAVVIEEHDLYLTFHQYDFGYSVLCQLSNGDTVSDNVKRILVEILAKRRSNSRKNSKAYKAEYKQAEIDVNDFLESTADERNKIQKLQEKMSRHNMAY